MSPTWQASPSTGTWSTWRCSTAEAQARCRTPAGQGGEGGAEGAGGEGHGPGGEGSGSESGASGSEEGSGAQLALDDTFDAVRSGARLVLNYDAASNAFIGTVGNTSGNVLRWRQDRSASLERHGTRAHHSGGPGSGSRSLRSTCPRPRRHSPDGWLTPRWAAAKPAGSMAATASPVASMVPAVSTVPAVSGVVAGRSAVTLPG